MRMQVIDTSARVIELQNWRRYNTWVYRRFGVQVGDQRASGRARVKTEVAERYRGSRGTDMALSENIETLYLFFPCCHAIQYITLGAPGGYQRR
jgi:hypothetical protein